MAVFFYVYFRKDKYERTARRAIPTVSNKNYQVRISKVAAKEKYVDSNFQGDRKEKYRVKFPG